MTRRVSIPASPLRWYSRENPAILPIMLRRTARSDAIKMRGERMGKCKGKFDVSHLRARYGTLRVCVISRTGRPVSAPSCHAASDNPFDQPRYAENRRDDCAVVRARRCRAGRLPRRRRVPARERQPDARHRAGRVGHESERRQHQHERHGRHRPDADQQHLAADARARGITRESLFDACTNARMSARGSCRRTFASSAPTGTRSARTTPPRPTSASRMRARSMMQSGPCRIRRILPCPSFPILYAAATGPGVQPVREPERVRPQQVTRPRRFRPAPPPPPPQGRPAGPAGSLPDGRSRGE